jgi:hypothetical protein
MSKHTIIPLLAAAITLCTVAANAGQQQNGANLNGASLNGSGANGVSLNGTSFNGPGLGMNGIALNGLMQNGIGVQGRSTGTTDALVPMRMVLPDGTVLPLR